MTTYTLTDAKNTATVARALNDAVASDLPSVVFGGRIVASLSAYGVWYVSTHTETLGMALSTTQAVELITTTARDTQHVHTRHCPAHGL